MNATAECTIDLDDKRRVWSTVNAEDIKSDELIHLAMSAATSAQAAYEKVIERSAAGIVRRAERQDDGRREQTEAEKLSGFKDHRS